MRAPRIRAVIEFIGDRLRAPSGTLEIPDDIDVTGDVAVTGAHSASSGYTGDLTGDVTGDITGDLSGGVTLTKSLVLERVADADDYATITTDLYVGITNTDATRTVTLSTADVADGRVVVVKDESGLAGTNNITIDTEGSETIDGAASVAIDANYGAVRLISDGTNWFTW